MANSHGGARAGAGRPPGRTNSTPAKSLQAQQAFAEMVLPRLRELADVLFDIATDSEQRASDRISAVQELLNRALGRPREHLTIEDTRAPDTAEDLADLWGTDEPA